MISLYKIGDQTFIKRDGHEDEPVKFAYLQPLSAAGQAFSIICKEDSVTCYSFGELDPDSAAIAKQELDQYYCAAIILRVYSTDSYFGNRYWDVETDKGRRKLAMKNPYVNVRRIGEQEMVVRDVLGNTFKVPSISNLDESSQQAIERVV